MFTEHGKDQGGFSVIWCYVSLSIFSPTGFNVLTLPQIKWLDKEGTEIEKNEKKKNIVDEEEEVEGTKLHNAVSTIKLKVTIIMVNSGLTITMQCRSFPKIPAGCLILFDRKKECMEHNWLRSTNLDVN